MATSRAVGRTHHRLAWDLQRRRAWEGRHIQNDCRGVRPPQRSRECACKEGNRRRTVVAPARQFHSWTTGNSRAPSPRAGDVCTEQTEARPSRTARWRSHVVGASGLGNGCCVCVLCLARGQYINGVGKRSAGPPVAISLCLRSAAPLALEFS
ncbi:hypothetical protein GY45DRAFT_922464 [Cubamyces sp. BRFM 1775]|nr:hypothetical protein GY45DRAFT_922464 [Cubamyces sp. BRFM 1775]